MTYERWIARIARETNRGEDKERQAIRLLAAIEDKPDCKVWADVERERVNQEQLG